jgi:hypothetical protein
VQNVHTNRQLPSNLNNAQLGTKGSDDLLGQKVDHECEADITGQSDAVLMYNCGVFQSKNGSNENIIES